MKNSLLLLLFVQIFMSSVSAQNIHPKDVKAIMKKVADWQIAHFKEDFGWGRVHHIADWTNGALYVGMDKWASMANDEKYYEWLKSIGDQQEWKLHKRQYHADDHTIGQLYCQLYRKYKDRAMIEPTIKQFNFINYHP